jgi:hypothetical protein
MVLRYPPGGSECEASMNNANIKTDYGYALPCEYQDREDGTSSHPDNMTPECHEYCCPKVREE